jgi:RNA polymerase sigma-70 factor (ECF subfamily)
VKISGRIHDHHTTSRGSVTELADDNDAALVSRALDGDTDAYGTLVRRHFDSAFAIARRLTVSPADAEDACQEAFARAYFRLDRCGRPSQFREWLHQIVRHHAHNIRRYQALRAAASLNEAQDVAADATTSDDSEISDLRNQLASALATLSPVKRAVIQHHDVDGWTHPQVAQALGISVLMSRRHLSDARAALRAQLTKAAQDYFGERDDYE